MDIEIERKFLTLSDSWKGLSHYQYKIVQGYFLGNARGVIRLRLKEGKPFITFKGKADGPGATEIEHPYGATSEEVAHILSMCDGVVEKTRYLVQHHQNRGLMWEVDEFLGDNAGLVVAEMEIPSLQQRFDLPDWIGEEVTGDERYFNANLVRNPYSLW